MKSLLLITSMLVLGMMGVGCSKSNTGAATNNVNTGTNVPAPVVIDPGAPGSGGNPTSGTTTVGGSTSDFVPASMAAMSKYTMVPGNMQALNNPTNIKVNLNLSQAGSGRYGGSVTISYVDNGIQHKAELTAGLGKNPVIKGGYDNDRLQADYNYWFNFENQLVFTGFFEDQYGAITLTLVPENVSGGGTDAEPLTQTYKGSIYFKNFTSSLGMQVNDNPYRSCWFVYTGVFDCRSNVIQTKCGLAPGVDAGYTLLGTFTNVDIKKAFNID